MIGLKGSSLLGRLAERDGGTCPVSTSRSSWPSAIHRLIVRRFSPSWRAMAAFERPCSR
jgi:hypothetical protein